MSPAVCSQSIRCARRTPIRNSLVPAISEILPMSTDARLHLSTNTKPTKKKVKTMHNNKRKKTTRKLRRISQDEFTPMMNSVGRALIDLNQLVEEVYVSQKLNKDLYKIQSELQRTLGKILYLRTRYKRVVRRPASTRLPFVSEDRRPLLNRSTAFRKVGKT